MKKRALLIVTLVLSVGMPAFAGGDSDPAIDPASLDASIRLAADWLTRQRTSEGDFEYGREPSLDVPLADNAPIRQAGAAAALAQAASYLHDDSLSGAAADVLRTLIAKHTKELANGGRRPSAPRHSGHPLGLAALLVLGIGELDSAPEPLLAARRELAEYLLLRQRADGSFNLTPSEDPADDDGEDDLAAIAYYPGEAMYALARGSWGDDALDERCAESVRRAGDFYRRHWHRYREPAFIPWQTLAHAERYAATRERSSADFVFAMNDWLLGLQIAARFAGDPWAGGFADYVEGQMLATEPGIHSASYAESLVAAWRTARMAGDADREAKYLDSLASLFSFLGRLQYRQERVAHFVPEYRPRLLGAFYASPSNGMIRIDFTQHALMAMCAYRSLGGPAARIAQEGGTTR